jgi:DNA mismatch endonuclease (patch repair protein)
MNEEERATERSRIMALVRGVGNASTEGTLSAALREWRITGWRRHLPLYGKPDFTFRREHIVIFVDGCFWHSCPRHGRKPLTNRRYWIPKLTRNRARDKAVSQYYRLRGWTVLRFWEHEVSRNPVHCVRKIKRVRQKAGKLRQAGISTQKSGRLSTSETKRL